MQTIEQLRSGKLKDLSRIKLSCGLTSFPEEIYQYAETLEILDLTGNHLSVLPSDLSRFKNLKIAFFSNNDFTEFPVALASCPQLEMIGFKANKIAYIPEGSFPKNLRWLILTDNCIEQLPVSIGNCIRIQKLMLAGNRLKELPWQLSWCINLELFRISANNFMELPDWLFTMPKLAWLAFAGNSCSAGDNNRGDLKEVSWKELNVLQLLGEGASGIIRKGEWISENNKEVAIKVFKGQVTSDGLPEEEMAACIGAGNHPNLVRVLGKLSGHPEHKQGLVLNLIPPEYINLGGPPDFNSCTRDIFPPDKFYSPHTIYLIAAGIASACEHIHALDLMHGDLYAHNILINKNGNPLFGDFGAGTFYKKFSKANKLLLEKLEVRAYGYLLEDLLNFVFPQNRQDIEMLHELKVICLQEDVSARPAFNDIVIYLKNFPVHTI